MTIVELKKKYGLDQRSHEVACSVCGKKIVAPTMYSEKERNAILHPYCCAATVLTCQWLIHHGWHVSSIEANPPHQYYCPDCFPKGIPEYHKAPYAADWCDQAEKWMKEENA